MIFAANSYERVCCLVPSWTIEDVSVSGRDKVFELGFGFAEKTWARGGVIM